MKNLPLIIFTILITPLSIMSEPSSEKNIELQRQMWDRVIQQRSYFLKEALKSHSYKKENIKKHQYRGERKKRKIEIARFPTLICLDNPVLAPGKITRGFVICSPFNMGTAATVFSTA